MKTRLEEIESLLLQNAEAISGLWDVGDPLWDLIDERVELEIEKHDLERKY